MATEAGVKYIAFPAISCGEYGLVAIFSNSCDRCFSHCVSFWLPCLSLLCSDTL